MALPWPGSTALLLLWVCCTAGEVRNCGYLDIPNGHVYGNEPATSFPKRLGDKHYYRCDSGFLPPNKAQWQTIVCTRSGWDPEPNCFKKCEHTEPIRNGRFIYGRWTSPFIEGDTIFFSCDEGYNPLDESATATCTKDGWSPPPSCVISADVTCRDPPLVDNADIVEERAESYLPGHELHYQCHEGFETSGSDTIRCENKKWSTPPRCEDMRCPPPPAIQNGQLNGVPKPRYLPLEKVKYRCLPSYSLFGPYAAMCLKREWINLPECRAVAGRCDRPPSIDNGDILEMAKSEYLSGEKVHYKCQNLYRMDGNAEVTCDNGHWTQPPTCIVPCSTSEEDMKMNNIQLKWKYDSKLYAESGDITEFACRWGYRADRNSPPFRVQCIDGRFEYPRCVRWI
ncbi:complement factor H-related protein 1 [Pogona vitticeps]